MADGGALLQLSGAMGGTVDMLDSEVGRTGEVAS